MSAEVRHELGEAGHTLSSARPTASCFFHGPEVSGHAHLRGEAGFLDARARGKSIRKLRERAVAQAAGFANKVLLKQSHTICRRAAWGVSVLYRQS